MRSSEPSVDLVFADPPFNIGYKYDVYEDELAYEEYYNWTRDWMAAASSILKPTGSFWIAIGDEYAAEVRMIGRQLGLTLRNWGIWHYTFGQNTKAKFARAHAHLFYFVKDPREFTFNDMAVRSFSDRQRIYRDKRANPKGKIPDDVWNEFPRVCGTFNEREGWHPCQMPISLLSRIIRACSNLGDLVFDPFAGSGTTLVAAKRLDRRYLGTELSEDYVRNVGKRLETTVPIREDQADDDTAWPESHVGELLALYMVAGVSLEMLAENEMLRAGLTRQLGHMLESAGDDRRYTPQEVLDQLCRLCSRSRLPIIKVNVSTPASVRMLKQIRKGRSEVAGRARLSRAKNPGKSSPPGPKLWQ
jgi:site-specific DNA-methyltransferase (adenine-specific)